MEKFTDIHNFISWVEKQKRFTPKVSLDKMNYYCSLFDHPEKKFKSIHITGTNGKGSIVAYLRSIFKRANLKIGTFTSPYITIFNERIQYNEEYITDDELLKIANLIISKYPTICNDGYETPSFFEFITLICFIYFASIKELDLALIEVGMGGRLDATNVIDSELAIITNVTLEHTQILGNTEEKIAFEKLGIVKKNTPLICGVKDPILQNYILRICSERKSDVTFSSLTAFEIKKMDIYGSEFIVEGYGEAFKINLAGKHQIENAILAIKTIEKLNQQNNNHKWNFPISNVILREGLQNVCWPGRLEILSNHPLILIDGAHNIDGITRICEFVKLLDYPFKRAVISISKDKEKEQMISLLDDTFDQIIFTKYTYTRSADAIELYNLSCCKNKMCIEDVKDAYEYVKENQVSFTIFMGSLYLVTEVRKEKE